LGPFAEIWRPMPTLRNEKKSELMKRPDRTELLVMAALAAVAILFA
jgi:hypothetical protein